MRIRTLAKWLVLGGSVAAVVRATARRARRARRARDNDLGPDPRDPVQNLQQASELYGAPLDVDVQSHADAEAAQDLAMLESELDEQSLELDTPSQTDADAIANAAHDVGELYGVHVPPAVDTTLPDDDRSYSEGANWLEALETSAVENGAEPEREIDIVDDADLEDHHPTDTRDIPVADRGSAGPRGL